MARVASLSKLWPSACVFVLVFVFADGEALSDGRFQDLPLSHERNGNRNGNFNDRAQNLYKFSTAEPNTVNVNAVCPSQPVPVEAGILFPAGRSAPAVIAAAFEAVGAKLKEKTAALSGTCFSAAVRYAGRTVWMANYGNVNASLSPAVEPTLDTIYRIGSVSKLFPTTMLYHLAEQPKSVLSIDDRIQDFAPEFSMRDPFSRSAPHQPTFRQVASQLAGLPREAPCSVSTWFPDPGFSCNFTSTEMFQRLSSMSFILPPDVRPSYSNLGYALLGRVLAERVASPSTTFEDWVQRYIANPLGMTRTGSYPTAAQKADVAVGYIGKGEPAPPLDLGWVSPAGQMFSSINDMLTFLDLFAESYEPPYPNTPDLGELWARRRSSNPGSPARVISVVSARQMMQPLFVNPDGTSMFASPWETFFVSPYVVRTKSGNVPGYTTLVAVVPELRLSFAFMFNGDADEGALIKPVFELLIPAFDTALNAVQPAFPVPIPGGRVAERFSGTYVSQVQSVFKIVLAPVNGSQWLLLQGFGLSIPLTFTSTTENGDILAQFWVPSGKLPCMLGEELALSNEYVTFNMDLASSVKSFSLPGFVPGQLFTRQQ